MLRTVVPLALLLVAAAPKAGAPRGHPDAGENESAEACLDCHAQATPAVVKQWEGGPHGLVLVKCFVCHGTTGADFRRSPDVVRCRGCHADEASPGTRKASQACFTCHAPHTLAAAEGKKSPHASKAPGAKP